MGAPVGRLYSALAAYHASHSSPGRAPANDRQAGLAGGERCLPLRCDCAACESVRHSSLGTHLARDGGLSGTRAQFYLWTILRIHSLFVVVELLAIAPPARDLGGCGARVGFRHQTVRGTFPGLLRMEAPMARGRRDAGLLRRLC